MHRWPLSWIVIAAIVLTGCLSKVPEQAAQTVPEKPTGWLDPFTPLDSEVRLSTPNGIDLRQAVYAPLEGDSSANSILVRTRNYAARTAGEPDSMQLNYLATQSGQAGQLELPPGQLVNILVDDSHSSWAAVLLNTQAGKALGESGFAVYKPAPGEATTTAMAPALYPCRLVAGRIGCQQSTSIQLSGGLIKVGLSLDTELVLTDAAGLPAEGWLHDAANSSGHWYADFLVSFDPIHPELAEISYTAATLESYRSQNQAFGPYPYHVTYGVSSWQPPLEWVDDTQLATLLFLPDATGRSSRANHLGLFRLVVFDVDDGSTSLIADHLDPHLPIMASEGLLFYVRHAPGENGPAWELWASSANGLTKRRIWVEKEALYMSVEDALPGRLLAQRQYIAVVDGEPHLHSELREFSLSPLIPGQIELAAPELTGIQPAGPPAAVEAEAGTQSPFIPDTPSSGGGLEIPSS